MTSPTVPTVRNIWEAEELAEYFPAVLTVGPHRRDVQNFDHPDHTVISFEDCWIEGDAYGPKRHHVESIVTFGVDHPDSVLVHCHKGVSRSTAAAITLLLATGVDPDRAVAEVRSAHPRGRSFYPNPVMVKYAAELFRVPELPAIVEEYEYWSKPATLRNADGTARTLDTRHETRLDRTEW